MADCGLFGIYGHKNAAELTYLGLYSLQHRGQESAGIVVSDHRILRQQKGMGLVTDVAPQKKLMDRAYELAKAICELPQGALRSDKEAMIRGTGRPLEEALRIEAEMATSMFVRGDLFSEGAKAFLDKRRPHWKSHGL